MTKLIRVLAALALLVGVAVLVPAPAYAADDTLPRVKQELTRRIDLRLAALNRYENAIKNAKHMVDGHDFLIKEDITTARSGLTALKNEVAIETTAAELREDGQHMVNDYRVFLLLGPQVRLAIAGDAEQYAGTRLTEAHGTLTDLVAKAKAAGKDTAAAEQDLAEMKAALDKAKAGLSGQVAKLLAMQPSADTAGIQAGVRSVRQTIGTARGDLRTAAAEAKHVRDFLKP